ncbi:MAG TPA: ThuA domain-containing protein [Verrucomicrobia bacterium]|nr:ThuA domain-containing protein [Verrucomicrobiota bacterium]HOP98300.1 ThuA domain-containing protein [Verrucomicrobiota bacterium]
MKRLVASLSLLLPFFCAVDSSAADKKIVLIAGRPSHGPGQHEHNAGVLLFKKCLANVPGITVETHLNGWPTNASALDGADAVVIYADGGSGHPALQGNHLEQLAALRSKGAGLACIHYAVEPTKEKGQKEFIEWLGGCFETHWSVNPHWTADFKQLPEHPITRGVKPFKMLDEWYYHMRFAEGMNGVTPILSALPGEDTLTRPDGPHSGNPHVRKAVAAGEPQHVAWAFEGSNGARGFGFTGGHFHKNWGDDNMRKLVLNAILWIAKVEVPAEGVHSVVTEEDLQQNLDPKGGPRRTSGQTSPSN